MSSVMEHYEKHLAPIYSWMSSGLENGIRKGQEELAEIGLLHCGARYAVDLGAGFGMHSIPLAKTGCRVLAVDISNFLLEELKSQASGLEIRTALDDLLNFPGYLIAQPEIVMCMGDTLTHLPERACVTALLASVAEHIVPGGQFILSFRDYSGKLEGAGRFIPVKSDDSRILTCFLEYSKDAVQVYDILNDHENNSWTTRVSDYRKLRLDPSWVQMELEKLGFVVRADHNKSGMVRFCAKRVEKF